MHRIESTYIDPNVLSVEFACDLSRCHGACCTFPGGSGPPILASELQILEKAYAAVRHILPAEHVAIAERYGLFENDRGDWSIRCYRQRACIFVCYDGLIAKCAIEKAWRAGTFEWPKPQSCHLFPLRFNEREKYLYFEEFSECTPALECGSSTKTHVVDFLLEPLERVFGKAFYAVLRTVKGAVGQSEEDPS